jgi:DNA-binding MarR family transcriptional regulator
MTAPGRHPRHGLDELLTNGVRLSIVAALDQVDKAEFALVRDLVEIPDSTLSKHVATLELAGYLAVEKGRVGRRPRTWLKLTKPGRQALARHLAALRDIANLPAASTHDAKVRR